MKITTGKKRRPRNVMIYGEHGSGKTTLASTFPAPIIIDIEGGSDDLDVTRTERVKDYAEFQSAISWLITSDHAFSTAVVDSADWLETLVQQHVAHVAGVKGIEDIGYGKGYTAAADAFGHLITGFRKLNERGVAVVLIAHAKTVKHLPPDGDAYDRREPDLHAKASSLLVEFCDEVLYLTTKVYTRSEDLGGFKGERKIAISSPERILITGNSAAVVAKNRLNMPSEIQATVDAYASYISQPSLGDALVEMVNNPPTPAAGNISGLVKNGSSKNTN